MKEFADLLAHYLRDLCKLSQPQIQQLRRHYDLLQLWNRKLNLTSLQTPEEVVVRHYCESLALGAQLPRGPATVVDLGSGAGFPGYPVAVLRPDCSVTLVESNGRKCVFLREARRGLNNVQVTEKRAEDLGESFDWLISRAVRWRAVLALVPRLAAHVGLLVGQSDADEMSRVRGINWLPPLCLPWGDRRVILLGSVPRETC